MKLSAVLLAAGSSTRFGSNKLLHLLEGKPMAEYIMDTIADLPFEKVVVVTGFAQVVQMAEEREFCVAQNPQPQLGQARSVSLGLSQCGDSDGCMFFVSDQPNLTAPT